MIGSVENPIVAEMCPNCDREVEMNWDVKVDGYKAFCPYCGEPLMLCDECRHPDGDFCDTCDYDSETGKCKHNKVGRKFKYTVVVAYCLGKYEFYTQEFMFDSLDEAKECMFNHIRDAIYEIGASDFTDAAVDEDDMGARIYGKNDKQIRIDIRVF